MVDIYPVRACAQCASNLFMSISHFTTFQRGIMPFSISSFYAVCSWPMVQTHKIIMTKCNIERRRNWNEKTKERCRILQKMEWYRCWGSVDRHLPWSNQQWTTYRCQYDWFGCLFGCACSVPRFRLVSSSLCLVFFCFLVDCLLRFDGWQRSTKSMKCKCYKVHGIILTTCTQKTPQYTIARAYWIQSKSNFVLLSFHISHEVNLHSWPLYYLLLPLIRLPDISPCFRIFLFVLVMCTFFLSSSLSLRLFLLGFCIYCHPSVDCDITIESNK